MSAGRAANASSMIHRHHRLRATAAALSLALLVPSIAAPPAALGAGTSVDYLFLQRADAAAFNLPADARLISESRLPGSDVTVRRYQQYTSANALVDGAQLSVATRGGRTLLVIGSHAASPTQVRPGLTPTQAADAARRHADVVSHAPSPAAPSQDLEIRSNSLRLDAPSGRLFYRVESVAPGERLFQDVDATTGEVIRAWNAIQQLDPGTGIGVKGDRKSLAGSSPIGSLATSVGGIWRLQTAGNEIVTYDAHHAWTYGSAVYAMSDWDKSKWHNDDDWGATYQRAAVDAQYYGALTQTFFADNLGFDFVGQCFPNAIKNVVHYGVGYANAFWDGEYMVYGDGDGSSTIAMSGGQDVVTHELTHGVTDCRAPLDYHDQPGALNEAFSDMMAAAAEHDYEESVASNCRLLGSAQVACADWWIGEDVFASSSATGFRNLADPAAKGQPSHMSGYLSAASPTSGNDYGYVHTNSGIPNHAFYLMVDGGRNARCDGPTDGRADCDVVVPGIGMHDAEQIMFAAWGLLTNDARFCAARDATVAAADLLFPGSAADHVAADLAWQAVGVAACSTPGRFTVATGQRTYMAAAGGSVDVAVKVKRSGNSDTILLTSSDTVPAIASFVPTATLVAGQNSTTLHLEIDASAPSGVYPLLVSGSNGTRERSASVTLVVDGDGPEVAIGQVSVARNGTVGADGQVPLRVDWSATDALSGIASAALETSDNGSDWALVSGSPGAADLSASDGVHQLRASAQDTAGNSTTSSAESVKVTSYQETAATYVGAWSTSTVDPGWGTTRFSKQRGATASFSFSGTGVAWVSVVAPRRGVAKVYLDGVATKVNLYSPTFGERRVVFSATSLAPGAHTLVVWVKGKAGRPRVDVDGIVALG